MVDGAGQVTDVLEQAGWAGKGAAYQRDSDAKAQLLSAPNSPPPPTWARTCPIDAHQPTDHLHEEGISNQHSSVGATASARSFTIQLFALHTAFHHH